MAGRGLRRALTITDQTKSDLKTTGDDDENDKDNDNETAADEEGEFCRSVRRATIASPVRGGRTLMDIIRQEQKMSGSGSGSIRNPDDGTINWKSFKARLRLRRAGAAWSDRDPDSNPAHPNPNPNPLFARSVTVRSSDNVFKPGSATDDDPDQIQLPILSRPEESAGTMSLMALFEQGGGFGSDSDAGEDEEEEEEEEEEGEELYHACCVCMVRHKGAAFIPCGHTFCRLCSRELWVSRGNCPLCNGFILEILDIF